MTKRWLVPLLDACRETDREFAVRPASGAAATGFFPIPRPRLDKKVADTRGIALPSCDVAYPGFQRHSRFESIREAKVGANQYPVPQQCLGWNGEYSSGS